jgi:hypothetical protein
MRGGAPGYPRDAKGELFLLAVSNMVGEDTFYEASGARDSRFVADAAVRLYNERSLLKWDSVAVGAVRRRARAEPPDAVGAVAGRPVQVRDRPSSWTQ